MDSVALADQGVKREITVGIRYRARVKRHGVRDRVRSYPTKSALAFWAQSETLEAIWVVEVDVAAHQGGTAITWTLVDPSLPQIDLYEAAADESEEDAT